MTYKRICEADLLKAMREWAAERSDIRFGYPFSERDVADLWFRLPIPEHARGCSVGSCMGECQDAVREDRARVYDAFTAIARDEGSDATGVLVAAMAAVPTPKNRQATPKLGVPEMVPLGGFTEEAIGQEEASMANAALRSALEELLTTGKVNEVAYMTDPVFRAIVYVMEAKVPHG